MKPEASNGHPNLKRESREPVQQSHRAKFYLPVAGFVTVFELLTELFNFSSDIQDTLKL